jgi:hypothetical protein
VPAGGSKVAGVRPMLVRKQMCGSGCARAGVLCVGMQGAAETAKVLSVVVVGGIKGMHTMMTIANIRPNLHQVAGWTCMYSCAGW